MSTALEGSALEDDVGNRMHRLLCELFPICRSITGEGVRRTLGVLKGTLPIQSHEIPTGEQVFDWTVPREWIVRDAWIKDANGKMLLSFLDHNLHLMSYSSPFAGRVTREELLPHLRSLPSQPDVIPYFTSYYKEDWAFCVKHSWLESLQSTTFDVLIDTELIDGHLTYGELVIPGTTRDEFVFSTHICHPSLANDNLSGIVVAHELAKWLSGRTDQRYTYRIVFVPGTIGAITWLAMNERSVQNIRYGLVISGVGDPGQISYKRSRRGNAEVDLAVEKLLRVSSPGALIEPFSPYGYDERQYCSPGFNLPIGRVSRSPYGTYPQYHTSNDNPDFVRPKQLSDSLDFLKQVVLEIENAPDSPSMEWSLPDRKTRRPFLACDQSDNKDIGPFTRLVNTHPKCEPQLGKRGLYQSIDGAGETMAMLWVLNFSDGESTIEQISKRADIPIDRILKVARILLQHQLLERLS